MKKVIDTERIPIKLWLDDIDDNTLYQAQNLANLPFAFKHVCLMPDAHSGYGMPIGGVLAADGVIVPNAVGVDIGCGMCAVKTDLKFIPNIQKKLGKIVEEIRKKIPVGFTHHKNYQDEELMPQNYDIENMPVVKKEYKSALKQLGTLGGGNHFIEIQKDKEKMIWIMIHSGSRNIGKQVADHYNKIAKKLNAMWYSSVNPKADLAFLPFNTDEAHSYYNEMKYCVEFALANRKLMLTRVQEVLADFFPKIDYGEIINIAHNYATWENHFGKNVIVHRKGATSAHKGELGIIPGSQGTKSYIVEGLGNPESFSSCSHGAGRIMGRNEAIRSLSLEDEIKKLDKKGIVHSIKSQKDLDEAPSAYKNIVQVMMDQEDLVEIKVELSPLAVVKG
ncbi:MAG TPA: RtcB family protein [Bacteroidales bacterium]|nr:RtcB family protein [Bacteroidales bacterium]HOH23310.1 RtcB family protein [Bacteroidales bacterium]